MIGLEIPPIGPLRLLLFKNSWMKNFSQEQTEGTEVTEQKSVAVPESAGK
jgi:hypothetical protein